jgi:hypothetical protein
MWNFFATNIHLIFDIPLPCTEFFQHKFSTGPTGPSDAIVNGHENNYFKMLGGGLENI